MFSLATRTWRGCGENEQGCLGACLYCGFGVAPPTAKSDGRAFARTEGYWNLLFRPGAQQVHHQAGPRPYQVLGLTRKNDRCVHGQLSV